MKQNKIISLSLFLSLLLLISCNRKSIKKDENIALNFKCKNIDTCTIEKNILVSGKLDNNFWFKPDYLPEQFPYALFLANKHNNAFVQEAVYIHIMQDYNHPESSIILSDTFILNKCNSCIDSIKITNRYTTRKDYFRCEFQKLSELNSAGYFKGKRYVIPDSLSFNIAFRCLLESGGQNLNENVFLELSLFYLMGYGVKADIEKSHYWYNRYIECALNKNSLEDIQDIKINTNTSKSNIISVPAVEFEATPPKSYFTKNVINKIKWSGDTLLYNRLKEKFAKSNSDIELLYFSYIMANWYNYKPAYFDVYLYLWKTFNYKQKRDLSDISGFDETTKSIALYHLKKSAFYGNKKAIKVLNRIR